MTRETHKKELDEATLEHFSNPRNRGDMANPDASASVYNPACGDTMRLMLKIRDGVVIDVKWKAEACGASQAAASAASELVKGKTIAQTNTITHQQVADAIGGLLPAKFHSAVLAVDAIKAALEDYSAKRSR